MAAVSHSSVKLIAVPADRQLRSSRLRENRVLTKNIPANETRLPDPVPGEAMIVSKYSDDRRKAVILHPDDFDLFERYQRIFGARDAYELHLSETAVRAHAIGERGEDEPDLDTASLDIALAE